jgi:hypothetical protein
MIIEVRTKILALQILFYLYSFESFTASVQFLLSRNGSPLRGAGCDSPVSTSNTSLFVIPCSVFKIQYTLNNEY